MPNFTNGEWDFIEYPMNNNKEKWYLVGSTEKAIGFIRHKADARLIAAAPELYELVMDELRGEAGGILSFDRKAKIKAVLNRIDGKEENTAHEETE